ncbi:MAG: DoxX family membrane protein [candidate division Zixibacteria bacterium]|nr:DoxX family membrane protein [candidate division Zixibacteria bacterium]
MKKFLSNDYLTMLCRLFIGGLFIYSALDKIVHPEQFARIVYNYHLVPSVLINLFALAFPMTEFIGGVCLIFGLFYTGTRNYFGLLMIVFIFAIGINVIRGVDLECGCFTVSSKAKSAGIGLIVRDLALFIPGILLFFSKSRRWMLDNLIFRTGR